MPSLKSAIFACAHCMDSTSISSVNPYDASFALPPKRESHCHLTTISIASATEQTQCHFQLHLSNEYGVRQANGQEYPLGNKQRLSWYWKRYIHIRVYLIHLHHYPLLYREGKITKNSVIHIHQSRSFLSLHFIYPYKKILDSLSRVQEPFSQRIHLSQISHLPTGVSNCC